MPERERDSGWERGWDGHQEAQRRRLARLPLWVKLDWLEQAQELVQHLRRSTRPVRPERAPPA